MNLMRIESNLAGQEVEVRVKMKMTSHVDMEYLLNYVRIVMEKAELGEVVHVKEIRLPRENR